MASPVGDSVAKRKLNDLRVIDIKEQLELRGLEKTGVKAALIERLKKAVEEEGLDPEEYLFEIDIKKVTKPESKDMENEEDELGDDVNKSASDVKKCVAVTDNGDVSVETNVDEGMSTDQPEQDSVISSTPMKAGNSESVQHTSNSVESLNLGDELNLNADNQSNTEVVNQASQKQTTDMEQTQDDATVQSQNISVDTEDSQVAESKTPEKNEEHETDIDASTALDNEQQQQQPTAATELPSGEKMLEPPSPDSVPVVVPFTKDDLIHMDTSADRQVDEDISLIVHIDESQMDLDNDLLNTPAKQSDPAQKSDDGGTTSMAGGEPAHVEEGSKDLEEKKDKSEEKEEGEAVAEQSGGESSPPENEQKSVTSQSKDGDKAKSSDKTNSKDGKAKSVSSSSRSLWISGLASSTRATDLKTLFSKYGKVAGAKVVTNAKSPGSRCYGFVTMNTADEASKCIQHLHRTELHGKMISVERAKGDPSAQAKTALKGGTIASQKKEDHASRGEKRDTTHEKRRSRHRSSGHSREHDHHHSRRSSGHRSPGSVASSRATRERDTKERESKDRKSSKDKDQKSKDKDILDFEKIKAERERERLKQRERQMREEERRRMRELERMRERQHDIERRQKEEAMRLEREKQKLRLEQQRLERERLEAERERIALERERQRRERENLEREREQERLHQLRLEQERRAMKRTYDARPGAREEFWSDPKRLNLDRGPRYEDRPGGDVFMRRIERYDRRDGRPIDPVLPRAPDRFEGRRDDKHEVRRPPGPHRDTKDRDDRGRGTDDRGRNMRYPDRRDGPPGRDHDRGRHERDRSPHAPAHPNGPPHHSGPPRSSPAHRQADSRTDWKSERNAPVREGRGRGCGVGGGALARLPSSTDRGFGEGRGSGGHDSWHINRAGKPGAQDNCAQPRGYNTGIGGRPGGLGHDWNSGDRGAPASGPNVSSRPGDRGWTGAPSQGADRVGVRPQPAALAVQQPLLQTPPTSAAFLASATNIMMGVGLGGGRNSTQEARYDAYKTIQGGSVGRY